MAIDFPNTPTTNQIYTVGSRSWKWDGTIWAIYSNNPVLYRQDSPPSSPQEGDQWFETDTGRMFVYYGTAWVELGNATDVAGALQPSQVTALSAVTTLTSDDVFPVVDGPSGAVASSKITYGDLVTNMSSSLAPGLVLVGSTTITSATTAVLDGCFSSTYRDYLLTVDVTGGTSNTELLMQFRVGGVASATLYNYAQFGTYPDGTVANGTSGGAATSVALTFIPSVQNHSTNYYIGQPNLATHTSFSGDWLYDDGGASIMRRTIGRHRNSVAYTGVQVLTGSAWTGKISVYGYRS